jgi:polyphosphate kinase
VTIVAKLPREEYEKRLREMQVELNGLARWVQDTGQRILIIFEGRDTAGKGGAIRSISDRLNPRMCHVVALAKPTERERTQWYFQRYVAHLPAAGEIVLLDRSWYNRPGVERVMDYCSDKDIEDFFRLTPGFERAITSDGIRLFKYYLTCDQKEQEKRFAERLSDPVKQWKLSPIDLEARQKYEDYTDAREAMLKATHTKHAPWTLVDFNDQKLGRLTLLRDFLDRVPDKETSGINPKMPRLKSKPRKERFGKLKPIPTFSG